MPVVDLVGPFSQVNLDETIRSMPKHPNVLFDMLFPTSTERLLSEESVAWATVTENLQVAPFTKVNGQPVNLSRNRTTSAFSVATPYIAVKLPFEAQSDVFKLMPFGDNSGRYAPIGRENPEVRRRIMAELKEDLKRIQVAVSERKEWMAAQALTGTLTYTSSDENGADFSINFAKPAGNTITPSALLDDSDTDEAIKQLILTIQGINKLQSTRDGANVTDIYCGADVAAQITEMKLDGVFDKYINNDYRITLNGAQMPNIELFNDITNQGYSEVLLQIGNVRFVSYTRQIDGVNLIGAKKMEVISRPAIRENRTYYGAIKWPSTIMKGNTVGKYISYSFLTTDDPSTQSLEQVYVTRPLPLFRRPDWYYTINGVS
jgi:hypothetical protein